MKQLLALLLIPFLGLGEMQAQILPNFGGERAGLSALSFLKNDMSPRSLGMASTSVSLDGDAFSFINNPAALTDLRQTSYALSSFFMGGGINQSFAGLNLPLSDKVSNLGFSVNALNSGNMEERTEFMPMGTGRTVSVSNIALGATYSRMLSDMFSAGVTLKYVYEGVAGYSNHNATVDVAFLYKTDFKQLRFAVMVQNFGGNSSLGGDDDIPVTFNRNTGIALESNTVPTVFSLGASFVPYEVDRRKLLVSVQLNHPNDNAENISAGAEYSFADLLYLRAGYRISVKHKDWPTFGFSLRHRLGAHPFYIDYALSPTNYIGVQHLIGLRFLINNDQR